MHRHFLFLYLSRVIDLEVTVEDEIICTVSTLFHPVELRVFYYAILRLLIADPKANLQLDLKDLVLK